MTSHLEQRKFAKQNQTTTVEVFFAQCDRPGEDSSEVLFQLLLVTDSSTRNRESKFLKKLCAASVGSITR